MSGTADKSFSVGDKYWCVDPYLSTPLLGTIIALTDNNSKKIGLEFAENIGSPHGCDNAGREGFCLWTNELWIYNETEWESVEDTIGTQKLAAAQLRGNRYDSISIDEDGNVLVDGSTVIRPSKVEDEGKAVMPSHKG